LIADLATMEDAKEFLLDGLQFFERKHMDMDMDINLTQQIEHDNEQNKSCHGIKEDRRSEISQDFD
ncbi:unnamed protein product, partial [Heterotrigona itama]